MHSQTKNTCERIHDKANAAMREAQQKSLGNMENYVTWSRGMLTIETSRGS